MTVPSQTNRDQQAGNGVTTAFTVPFRILDQTHIRILLTVSGVTTEQVLTTNYTVSGVGGANTTVTMLVAPPNGSTVTFLRNVPSTQETDYVPNDPFPAESHERALDKLTMIVQQLAEENDRALTVPASSSATGQLPTLVPLSPIVVNAAGTGFEMGSTTQTGDMLLRPDLATTAADKGAQLVGFLQAGTGATARTARDKMRDTVHAKDFGVVANGSTSDSAAMALAVAYAAANQRTLILPSGVIRLTGTLTVPSGVTITGDTCQPYTDSNAAATPIGGGTWLHFDHAGVGINVVGSTAASAATVIRNLGTRRTHAAPGVGWTPTVYDYDILVQGVETFLDDVLLLNAYKGVKIDSSGFGKLWTYRLRGQVFAEGVNLAQSFDTNRIRDSHFWPYWSQHADVTAWQRANTKVIRIARADNSVISGLFAIYSAIGIEVYGTADGTAFKLRLSDVDMDSTGRGLKFDSTADGSTVFISNFVSLGHTGDTQSRGLEIAGNNNTVRLANCDFALTGRDGIRVDGTGNTVYAVNTQVRFYDQSAIGASAYEVAAGNTIEFADRPIATNSGGGPLLGSVANRYKAFLGANVGSGTTDGSGDFVVTHGLGTTPNVMLTGLANGSNRVALKAQTSTTFTVTLYNAAGSPVASTALNFNWTAWKF